MALQMSTETAQNPLLMGLSPARSKAGNGAEPAADTAEGSPAPGQDFAAVLGRRMPAPAQKAATPPASTQKSPATSPAATAADKAAAEKAAGASTETTDVISPLGAALATGTSDKEDIATSDVVKDDAATAGQPPEAPLMSLFMPASQALAQAQTQTLPADPATAPRGANGDLLPAALMGKGNNVNGSNGKPGQANAGPGNTGLSSTPGTPGLAASARTLDADGKRLSAASADAAGTAGKPLPGFMSTLQAATTANTAGGEKAALPMADLQAQFTPDRAIAHLPAAPISTPTPTAASVAIQTPLGTPGWDNQLGERVVWISQRQMQSAEISINPPELGPMELRLTLDNTQAGQQATLQFASPHAEVREALENALPQLREVMADAGITLGNATVGSESFRDQAAAERQTTTPGLAGQPAAPVADAGPTVIPATRRGNGLVDTFA